MSVEDIERELRELGLKVESLLSLYKLVNSKQILSVKEDMLRNETKRRIYELCDGRHTVTQITSKAGVSQPTVSYHLSSLLESGLIGYRDEAGNRYYFKALE